MYLPGTTIFVTQTFVESSLYGIYLVIFMTLLYLRGRNCRHSRGRVSAPKPAVSWVLLALIAQNLTITAHWILTMWVGYHTLIVLGGGQAGEDYYSNPSAPPLFAQLSMYTVGSIIADLLVIHRLYVIYSRRWIYAAFPAALLLGQLVSGTGSLVVLGVLHKEGVSLLEVDTRSRAWVTTSLVFSIVISVYSSGMIAWKILRMHRVLAATNTITTGGTSLMSFLAIIVESAGIQTATALAFIFTFIFSDLGQVMILEIAPVIVGISTVLIHVRVTLGWAHEPDRELHNSQSFNSTSGRDGSATLTRISFAAGRSSMGNRTQLSTFGIHDEEMALEEH
ncbi:hypothetical protein FB45DRAFT_909614, partial [Roridomyces roridus]